MKKLFSIVFAILALGVESSLATGAVGTDVPQSGVLTFTAATTVFITNNFAYPYTQLPVITFAALTTNALPITNQLVTLTNFIVSVNATNSQVAWSSFAGYQRIQYGTNAVQGSLLLTNTFSPAYVYNPVVSIEGSGTNALSGTMAVSSVSPTQFVVQFGNTNQVMYWMAIGTSASPGNYPVTR